MAVNKTVVSRIRKLRALAASTTFPEEADTALRLAAKLQAMAGLDEATVTVQQPQVIIFSFAFYGNHEHVSWRAETPQERNANAAREQVLWDTLRIDPRLR